MKNNTTNVEETIDQAKGALRVQGQRRKRQRKQRQTMEKQKMAGRKMNLLRIGQMKKIHSLWKKIRWML